MKEKFEKIYNENVVQSAFLDKESILKGMNESYILGKSEEQEKYDKLKNTFLELLEDWGDYGNYNSDRNQMEKDWKKQGGLI